MNDQIQVEVQLGPDPTNQQRWDEFNRLLSRYPIDPNDAADLCGISHWKV